MTQRRLGVKGAGLKPAPVALRVVVYEGAQAGSKQFARLCSRKTNAALGGVDRGYIARLDNKISQKPGNVFRLAVLKGTRAVGLAHCTLHARMAGFKQRRVVFVHLVCSDANVKGAGSILLAELEDYARSIGARVVALQSLPAPQVRGAYTRRGFVRGVGNRSDEALRLARTRFNTLRANPGDNHAWLLEAIDKNEDLQKYMRDQAVHGGRVSPAFLEALGGEFFPPYNSLYSGGDSVAMYKQLPANAAADAARVRWDSPDDAEFVEPRQRTLATYNRTGGVGRFTRVGRQKPPPPQPSSRSWLPQWPPLRWWRGSS